MMGKDVNIRARQVHLPTVSMTMVSKPAPSHSTAASHVLRATPPRVPEEGEGLMKALGSTESFGILVLSANREPADTATL